MIRAVDNKPLELSDDEFAYYMQIVEAFGANIFQNTFEVEEKEDSPNYGFIKLVTPPMNKNLPLGVVFFFDELYVKSENQRI